MSDVIFQPLKFKNLTVKNRVFRSNISGRFDNYDGSGNQARINWEVKFAKGGVGAIISSFVPVQIRGRIIPNYATIDQDERIPFWRAVGEGRARARLQVHPAAQPRRPPARRRRHRVPESAHSSTDKQDPLHGFECKRMTTADIKETVAAFAEGARRARDAGLDGVELHGANGYLITQFLSSGDQRSQGRVRRIAREPRALRHRDRQGDSRPGRQRLPSADEDQRRRPQQRAARSSRSPGNTVQDSVQVCKWLVDAGVDAIHVSTGSSFPHPRNPAGTDLPMDVLADTYEQLASSGTNTFRNLLLFQNPLTGELFRQQWLDAGVPADQIEGLSLPDARAHQAGGAGAGDLHRRLSDGVGHPATRSPTATATRSACARTLVANNDLVKQFAAGRDQRRQAVHLLQQVPGPRRRASARLLRGEPLPRAVRRCWRRSCRCSRRRRSRDASSVEGDRSLAGRQCRRSGRSAVWVVVALRSRSAGGATTRSTSTSSTDRSAASLACRCCADRRRRCRRTGCSRRCRRSAATSCRAATRRSGSSSEPGKDLPVGVSRRRRLGVDQVGLNCAVCHTGTRARYAAARRRGWCSACRRTSSICRRFVEFVLDCTLDNRLTAETVRGRLPRSRRARRSSSGCCSASVSSIG